MNSYMDLLNVDASKCVFLYIKVKLPLFVFNWAPCH